MSRVAVYFEAATVIVLLTLVGQLLELNARSRISDAISAQVTLIEGDLRGISIAQAFSVATMGNMKQNLMFTFLYNALGIPLAAGVL